MQQSLIIGMGAIGSSIAASLLQVGIKPAVKLRGDTADMPENFHRFSFSFLNQQSQKHVLTGAKLGQTYDAIFVCVKAYHLETVFQEVNRFCQHNTEILIIANGFIDDLLNSLKERCSASKLYYGIASYGISKRDTSEFSLGSKQAKLLWGPASSDQNSNSPMPNAMNALVNTELGDNKINFSYQENIFLPAREKFMVNLVANTLGAAYHLPTNGDLLAKNIPLESCLQESYKLGEKLFGWHKPYEQMRDKVLSVIHNNAADENSMARDLRLGHRTEKDYLSGLALKHEAEFPLLAELHRKIPL